MAPADPPRPARNSRSRIESFRHAFAGWWYTLRTQRNAWIHAAASVAVIAVSFWLRLELLEWALIVLAIGMVWAAEFMNTALEAVVDLASPDINPLARVGKDVAAAAVLVGAGTAVIVGLLVLGPLLVARVGPWLSALLAP